MHAHVHVVTHTTHTHTLFDCTCMPIYTAPYVYIIHKLRECKLSLCTCIDPCMTSMYPSYTCTCTCNTRTQGTCTL